MAPICIKLRRWELDLLSKSSLLYVHTKDHLHKEDGEGGKVMMKPLCHGWRSDGPTNKIIEQMPKVGAF